MEQNNLYNRFILKPYFQNKLKEDRHKKTSYKYKCIAFEVSYFIYGILYNYIYKMFFVSGPWIYSENDLFLRVTRHDATLPANVCSNHWRVPIRNTHPLNLAFDWFLQTVSANNCPESCIVSSGFYTTHNYEILQHNLQHTVVEYIQAWQVAR